MGPDRKARDRGGLLARRRERNAAGGDAARSLRSLADRQNYFRPTTYRPSIASSSLPARTPSDAPPSMNPWKSVEQCSPAKRQRPCDARS